jgi:hypothetical protein
MNENCLTKKAATLFPLFHRFNGFYLVGGTALALQIGHRISVDFDFFSEKSLPAGLLQKIKRVFAGHSISVTYKVPEQLNLIIDEVKVTFFHYPYPIVNPLVIFKKVGVASIIEIASMKAFSIGKRLSYKDYVDWYFLIKEKHVKLNNIIDGSIKKFGNDFNDRLFLGQLVSMEDIPDQKIDFLRDEVDRKTIESTLREAVKALGI